MAVDKTLGAVFGAGKPTESIFQLTTADLAAGATGTGQHPESPATVEKSFPVPSAFPLDISIVMRPLLSSSHPLAFNTNTLIKTRTAFVLNDEEEE